jgi:CPA1 family monovalent cation:H+ antiporter
VAVGAVLLSRAVVVYGLSWLVERIVGSRQFPHRWRHVLFWGGLRGAISLALALSLPVTLLERKTLQAMTFGVLLFTLLGQGTTIRYLLKRLGLIERPKYQITHEMQMGRNLASHAGLRRLAELNQEGLLTDDMWAGLRDDYYEMQQNLVSEMNQLFSEHPELERETLLQARREALQTERVALGDALRRGLLSDEVYEELRSDVDRRLEAVAIILVAAQKSSGAAGEE